MSYCSNCGKGLPEGAKFCLECGAKVGRTSVESHVKHGDISDSVITRSTIGQSSVGSVNIAPTLKQEMIGSPTCSTCGNLISDTNSLHYCKICNTAFCEKCPDKSKSLVEIKIYEFEYTYEHLFNWTERVQYQSGDRAYYVDAPQHDTVSYSLKVEISKKPLCDTCYDEAFIEALVALKFKIRKTDNYLSF